MYSKVRSLESQLTHANKKLIAMDELEKEVFALRKKVQLLERDAKLSEGVRDIELDDKSNPNPSKSKSIWGMMAMG